MNNIMVCVTKQKTCERLINYGKAHRASEEDQLFVIHVAEDTGHFLGNSQEGDALEFLYEKAREAGATLTVEKSGDVIGTLVEIVDRHGITEVIAGQSGDPDDADSFIHRFEKRLSGKARLTVVPAAS